MRVFNYRLSRARRTLENAFGITSARFRVLRKPILLIPDHVEWVVSACCVLHNILRRKSTARNVYTPPGYADTDDHVDHRVITGQWRLQAGPEGTWHDFGKQGSNNYSRDARSVRDRFSRYFTSRVGGVNWQWKMVGYLTTLSVTMRIYM